MHMLPRVRSDGSYPCGGGKGCSVVGRVRHAEADSRNPLTGVVSQHTTVSAWVKSAGSASVCGMSALCLNRMDKDGGGIYLFIEEMQHQQRTVRMCFSVSDELCLKLLPTHSCFFVIPFFLLLIVSFWKSIRQVFCYVRRSFSMPIVIFLLWNKYTSCLDGTEQARRYSSLSHITMALSRQQQYSSLIPPGFVCSVRQPTVIVMQNISTPVENGTLKKVTESRFWLEGWEEHKLILKEAK